MAVSMAPKPTHGAAFSSSPAIAAASRPDAILGDFSKVAPSPLVDIAIAYAGNPDLLARSPGASQVLTRAWQSQGALGGDPLFCLPEGATPADQVHCMYERTLALARHPHLKKVFRPLVERAPLALRPIREALQSIKDADFLAFFSFICKKIPEAALFWKGLSATADPKERAKQAREWMTQHPELLAQIIEIFPFHIQAPMSFFPPEVGCLKRLTTFNIKSDTLAALPESLGELSELAHFSISGDCEIQALPDSLNGLPHLSEISISSKMKPLTKGLSKATLEHCKVVATMPRRATERSSFETLQVAPDGERYWE